MHGECSLVSKRSCAAILFGFFIICVTASISRAAVITPDLQEALQSAGPAGDISVIINLADKADLKQIAAVAPNRIAGSDKVRKRDAIIKALRDKANLTQGFLKALLQNRGAKKMKSLWITNSVAATVPASVISELMSLPEIESIELDSVIQAPPVVPAAAGNPEWNISRINAPALWSAGITGSGVVVANLDTGVDLNHPDLQPKWRGGSCAVPPNCDSWFDPYTNSTLPYDSAGSTYTGHGTGTMGIMVGGSLTDAYGVAPGVKWIAAKIFNETGTADESNIILAMQWLLAPGGNAASAPDIVNNSWGVNAPGKCFPALPNALETAIQNVQAAGIAMVFSAGNDGPNSSTSASPANYPGIFAVGATDFADTIAYFSSRGPSTCLDRTESFPNVVAPGTRDNFLGGAGIFTSAPVSAGSYRSVQGTSFSAPHVAGAEALLISAFPTLTPAQLETVLELTAIPLGSPIPNDAYGYGLIDAGAAYKSIFVSFKGDRPQIAALPSSWTFGNTALGEASGSSVFVIVNQGTADLVIDPASGGVSLTGPDLADFTITSDGCSGATVPSLGNCSVGVAFSPAFTGLKSAALTIVSNDTVNPSFDIPMSGMGVMPDTVARVTGTTIVAKYSVIQTAYNNCSSGDIIEMQTTTFYENLDYNSPLNIAVNLEGGYDTSFGHQSGFTTLQGSLTISSGTVTVGNLILQ